MVATGFPYLNGSVKDVSRPSVRVVAEKEGTELPYRNKVFAMERIIPSISGVPSLNNPPSSRQNSESLWIESATLHGCVSCGTLGSMRDTGPDGPQTLCSHCGLRYRNLKLRLYRLADGRVTAEPIARASLVRAVEFEWDGSGRDLQNPRVREVTTVQHSMLASKNGICLSCRILVEGLTTGPDGYRTLCLLCGNRYYRRELCVFRLTDGRVSVLCSPGAKRVIIVGFEESIRNIPGRYDIRFPIVRDARPGEHAKHHPGENGICGLRTVQTVAQRAQDDDAGGLNKEFEVEDEGENDKEGMEREEEGEGGDNGEDGNLIAYGKRKRARNGRGRRARMIARDTLSSCTKEATLAGKRSQRATGLADRMRKQRDESLSFVVKATCSYGWETRLRYIYVAYGVTVSSFTEVLKETFRMDIPFSVCYKDDVGDLIHVSDDADMAPMFALARRRGEALQVQLRPP